MALSLLHATQATGTDAGNGDIHKAEWNQEHAIVMATNKLLGRSTAGTGSVEEIAIGSGLSLSAGTLSASGGGGGALTISNKTAAYTVVAGDLGTIINCTSGTFTVSLTAADTLGAGFNCWIWNTSTNAANEITIDPAGTETIDGRSTLALRRGEGMQIVCDGANWQTGDKKTMRGYSENITATSTRPLASSTNSVAIGTSSGSAGSQTVTGSGAMALGGSYSSGTDSFAASIANNTSSYGATGSNAVALGSLARATAGNATALGTGARADGTASLAISLSASDGPTASGTSSCAIGAACTASSANSFAFGSGAISSTNGKFVRSSFKLGGSNGKGQEGAFILGGQTGDATSLALSTDLSTAGSSNQINLPANSAYVFTGTVVARQQATGGTQSAAWKVEGLIRREATTGSTTLVASTVTAISNVPGWTLALSADTTNGGLAVTATGAAATVIRWVATVQTSEVTF